MKRVRQRIIAIGLFASAGFLVAAPNPGAEEIKKCSVETLHGQYLTSGGGPGAVFPPAFGATEQLTSSAAGYSVYNGDGTGMDYVTFTLNGVNAHVKSPQPFVYILNADCTGTRSVSPSDTPPGPNFDIFVAFDGSQMSAIATDNGFGVSNSSRRVGRR